MKHKKIVVPVIAVLGLATWGWMQGGVKDQVDAKLTSAAPEVGAATQGPHQSASRHPFPDVPRTRAGIELEGDPGYAESEAEQQWLDLHGFPNSKQWEVSRVSEMRGDLRASIGREVMMTTPLTPEQRLLGEAEALRLNEAMNKRYFEKYRTPAEFIPRPTVHS